MIRWTEDGTSFHFTVKPEEFEESHVMSRYFNHNKYSSFVRQLHNYGFTKLETKEGFPKFSHDYFQRERPDLIERVHRQKRSPVKEPQIPLSAQRLIQQLTDQNQILCEENQNLKQKLNSQEEIWQQVQDYNQLRRCVDDQNQIISSLRDENNQLRQRCQHWESVAAPEIPFGHVEVTSPMNSQWNDAADNFQDTETYLCGELRRAMSIETVDNEPEVSADDADVLQDHFYSGQEQAYYGFQGLHRHPSLEGISTEGMDYNGTEYDTTDAQFSTEQFGQYWSPSRTNWSS